MVTLTIYVGNVKPLRAVGRHQCKALEFAEKYPGWHSYKQDRVTKRAIIGLEKRGCVEVVGDQYRISFKR